MLDILNPYIKTKVDVLRQRPGGQILNLLDWVINGGAAKWGDSVTYNANTTIEQPFILADVFTVDEAKILTPSQYMPLVVVADTVSVSGTITASEKGCGSPSGEMGQRCKLADKPVFGMYSMQSEQGRNHCLCGSGGNNKGSPSYTGGGAFKDGGDTVGEHCDLTAAELKQLLFSPLFDIYQIGLGGGGGHTDAWGASSILIIARVLTLTATANILANGAAPGGGGGFIGLIGDTLTVNGAATLSANGGADNASGYVGGNGVIAQIEV